MVACADRKNRLGAPMSRDSLSMVSIAVAVDRAIQVAPAVLDLEMGRIDIPVAAGPASQAQAPLAQDVPWSDVRRRRLTA